MRTFALAGKQALQAIATTVALAATLNLAATTTAQAEPSLEQVKTAVQKQLGKRAAVKSVAATPVSGLYEVNIGGEIAYFDATGRYMLQGEMMDLQTGDNVTERRQSEMSRIKWADLPLNQAIKWTRGDGSRKIAVFSDPNCGYCKRLEQTLQGMNNITVYTFLFPVLGEDSTAKSKQIWCASDRTKTWLDWMLRGSRPMGADNCSTPLEKNLALGKGFGVRGTPAIFFTDGTRIPGAAAADKIEQKLASAPK